MQADYQVCTKCVMDNSSDTTIYFNTEGQCNYCSEALERRPNEYFPGPEGRKKLEAVMEKIKKDGKGKKYDCIVGISGGVDSSYLIYLGHQYGLRMLAVHIDDGFNNPIATSNIKGLCRKAKTDLIVIKPNKQEFADLTLSFLKASVPNIAVPQDNVLFKSLYKTIDEHKINYTLIGANYSLESILERSTGINASDKTHILALHKKFGTVPLKDIQLQSLTEKYLYRRYFKSINKVLPLNFIDYNLKNALNDLKEFSNYEYYGGKHYENILTRFLQCYYLPKKFGVDKRKSHFSSLIVSGQMTRDEAISLLNLPLYPTEDLLNHDLIYISNYFNISRSELENIIALPPKKHSDYPVSPLNKFAKVARHFRQYLD